MFIYSEREGTPAAIHFKDVPREVKVERLGRLIELSKEVSLEQNRKWVGREVEVLVKGKANEEFSQGHTRGNHVAMVKGDLANGIHRVTVAHATPNRLYCVAEAGFQMPDASGPPAPDDIYQLISKI
jgi:tRNA-2-methylthio-N6-dimethylallyladenosine synthase